MLGTRLAVDMETWNGFSRLCVGTPVVTWNGEWMFTVVLGVCREVGMKCVMDVHGRAWHMPGLQHKMWNGCSPLCMGKPAGDMECGKNI